MTRNIYKISNRSKLGSHIVEGKVYVNITSIAEEYGMSLNTVYKRYSRGYRGDDLVPKHKHKSYVKPINLPNYNFFVKGIGYMSKAEACRKNNINYITFRKRMEYGWSLEDALTIPTKFHYCPNDDQGSGTAKSLTLEKNLGQFLKLQDIINYLLSVFKQHYGVAIQLNKLLN